MEGAAKAVDAISLADVLNSEWRVRKKRNFHSMK